MADHSKPTLTSNYTAFVDEIKGRLEDISKGFDPAKTSPANVPVDTIRWAGSSNKWQRWNGSSWVDLTSTYAISISGSAAKLATARSVALAGGATGSASFDGSANITINVTALNPSQLSSPVPLDKGGTGAASAAQARTNLGLGTAAMRDVTTSSTDTTAGRVLKVGDFGIGGGGGMDVVPAGYPTSNAQNITQAYRRNSIDNGVSAYAASWHFGSADTWGRLRISHNSERAWIQGGFSQSGAGWTQELYHSGNLPDIDWNSLTGKPSTFPPSSHTHPWNQITGAPATATRWPTWNEVTGKPSGFMPPTGHGAVGTYAFVNRRGSDGTTSWGSTISGSLLTPSHVGNNGSYQGEGTALSGTWRIMGRQVVRTTFGSNTSYVATLAVRIA